MMAYLQPIVERNTIASYDKGKLRYQPYVDLPMYNDKLDDAELSVVKHWKMQHAR